MKTFFLFAFIVGCASEVETPPTVTNNPVPEEKKQTEEPQTSRKCHVQSSQNVKSCVLFFLKCDDGSDDMILQCRNQPIGQITNPPRPI